MVLETFEEKNKIVNRLIHLNDIDTHLKKLRRKEKNICNAWLLNHAACRNDCNTNEVNLHSTLKPPTKPIHICTKVLMATLVVCSMFDSRCAAQV